MGRGKNRMGGRLKLELELELKVNVAHETVLYNFVVSREQVRTRTV